MASRHVHIRKKNVPAWDALENKSGWVNDMIEKHLVPVYNAASNEAQKEIVVEHTEDWGA